MGNFLKHWNPFKIFKRDAWRPLEIELEAKIEPWTFFNSLKEKSLNMKLKLKGVMDFEMNSSGLLKVAETRRQNRLFKGMTEKQKIWTTANTGNTQGWTQTLHLSHLDNALTNFEFRAIFRRRARIPVFTGAMKFTCCKNLTADQYGDHTLRCENKIQRHNFVSARLEKIIQTCGY